MGNTFRYKMCKRVKVSEPVREMLNCDGVTKEASANPTGGSEAGSVMGFRLDLEKGYNFGKDHFLWPRQFLGSLLTVSQ